MPNNFWFNTEKLKFANVKFDCLFIALLQKVEPLRTVCVLLFIEFKFVFMRERFAYKCVFS